MQLQRFQLGRLYRAAQRRLLGPRIGTLTHVKTTQKVVALTFDDGPSPESTPELLDLLAKHGAKATFFMIGEAARRYPELVARVAAEGHAIGNHTCSHVALTRIGRKERLQEIRAWEPIVGSHGQRLFRPPYGEQTLAARLDLLRCGYRVVAWNMDSGDWWNPDGAAMADAMVSRIRPGSIVLLHDTIHRPPEGHLAGKALRETNFDRRAMLRALAGVLERLRPTFQFVTVPELVRHGRPQHVLWRNWADSPAVKR